MAFDWNDFLELARDLATNGPDEREYRTAVSRAYYALFNRAADDFRSRGGFVAIGESSHNRVWNDVESSQARGARKLSAQGKRLRGMRVDADYKASEAVGQAQTASAVHIAVNGLTLLDQLRLSRT